MFRRLLYMELVLDMNKEFYFLILCKYKPKYNHCLIQDTSDSKLASKLLKKIENQYYINKKSNKV